VRVNAVGPGVIEVPRYFDMPGYTTEFGNTLIPWGRVGHPGDIAPAVAFLAGDGADFITGQTLYVDGGTNARMGLWWESSAP
jgi:NAD(P)-dependent dehydrogenase (short-subunit alcohol dehydrogenase family)